MAWAAWADAYGFISELVDEKGLERRLEGRAWEGPVPWRRRVGGRFGVDVLLPAGCYSDDTQLRLATARAISGSGFDVEAFAKVELPIWPAYALGGGRASKAAAAHLSRSGTAWFGNFYEGWMHAGGNGVAMRIQPHVLSAPDAGVVGEYLIDVLKNGITTHGHPRALAGAVLHALALGATLQHGSVPQPSEWPGLLEGVSRTLPLLRESKELTSYWQTSWEASAKSPLKDAWSETIEECRRDMESAAVVVAQMREVELDPGRTRGIYAGLTHSLGLDDPKRRGSGTGTVIAALTLAASYECQIVDCVALAVGALGTDTDTIATMAAAMMGAQVDLTSSPSDVLDSHYIDAEAARLAEISHGGPTLTFSYPDLLTWNAPKTLLDTVGLADGRRAIAGIGWCDEIEEASPPSKGARWLWTRSDFGPSFLVKERTPLRELPPGCRPTRRDQIRRPTHAPKQDPDPNVGEREISLMEDEGNGGGWQETLTLDKSQPIAQTEREETGVSRIHEGPSVDELLSWVGSRGFNDTDLGRALRRVAERGSVEQLIAFTITVRESIRRSPVEPRGPKGKGRT